MLIALVSTPREPPSLQRNLKELACEWMQALSAVACVNSQYKAGIVFRKAAGERAGILRSGRTDAT